MEKYILYKNNNNNDNNNGPPWGLYCFLYIITFYNFTVHADTDIEADDVGNFSVELAETRSWDLGVFFGFSSYHCYCRIGCRLLSSIALGQLHLHRYLLTLMRWLTRSGVTFGSAKVNSLYACVPSPGLELAPAPLTLVKHHTHRKVACLYPHAQTRGGRCARPATCVCQHH